MPMPWYLSKIGFYQKNKIKLNEQILILMNNTHHKFMKLDYLQSSRFTIPGENNVSSFSTEERNFPLISFQLRFDV